MPMREDCRHFAARTYDDGEVARFCILDLAPEAPWRCPEHCPSYEVTLIDGSFEQGSFTRPEVEAEPDEAPDAIGDLLDDAERIVEEAEPDVLRELSTPSDGRKWWQLRKRRKPPGDGEDWHFSSR
jgi:hypothetical protein